MRTGELVLYETKVYRIIYMYDSGYCEIKDISSSQITLVHKDELKLHMDYTDAAPL